MKLILLQTIAAFALVVVPIDKHLDAVIVPDTEAAREVFDHLTGTWKCVKHIYPRGGRLLLAHVEEIMEKDLTCQLGIIQVGHTLLVEPCLFDTCSVIGPIETVYPEGLAYGPYRPMATYTREGFYDDSNMVGSTVIRFNCDIWTCQLDEVILKGDTLITGIEGDIFFWHKISADPHYRMNEDRKLWNKQD